MPYSSPIPSCPMCTTTHLLLDCSLSTRAALRSMPVWPHSPSRASRCCQLRYFASLPLSPPRRASAPHRCRLTVPHLACQGPGSRRGRAGEQTRWAVGRAGRREQANRNNLGLTFAAHTYTPAMVAETRLPCLYSDIILYHWDIAAVCAIMACLPRYSSDCHSSVPSHAACAIYNPACLLTSNLLLTPEKQPSLPALPSLAFCASPSSQPSSCFSSSCLSCTLSGRLTAG